jgi:hypothetical protein
MQTFQSENVHLFEKDHQSFMAWSFPEFSFARAWPEVEILVGESETPQVLNLSIASEPFTWREITPLGQAEYSRQTLQSPEGFLLEWIVGKPCSGTSVIVTATFHNLTNQAVRLRRVTLLKTDKNAVSVAGEPSEWTLSSTASDVKLANLATVLPSKNDQVREVWKGFGLPVPYELDSAEKSNDGRWRTFRDFLFLYRDKGRVGLSAAAVGTESDVDFDCFVDGTHLGLEVNCRMSDVLIDPGESRSAETVAFVFGPYQESFESLLRWIAHTHGVRTHRGPIVGWCSWYNVGQKITAEQVINLAKTVETLRDRIPMQVIQIDDGFQKQVGDWDYNDKFPDGIKPVIDAIHYARAIPGIWLAPLAVHKSVGGPNLTCKEGPVLEVHPDWFQQDRDGKIVGEAGNWGPVSHWLDPTHPQAAAFIRRILRRKYEEGFRYFKIDFNALGDNVRWKNPKKTKFQIFRDLYRLYREEIGEDSYLMACASFTRGTFGIADAARIGQDSASLWKAQHPCCISACIMGVGLTAVANGHLYANDPDVSYTFTAGTLTRDELLTWHSFVGLLGGLMMTSDFFQEPEHQTDESLRMMEILTPPAKEKGLPFHGVADLEMSRFGLIAHRPWGSFVAAVIYNAGETPADKPLDIPQLSAFGSSFHAWSFWDGEYLGILGPDAVMKNLPSHGCKLLRLTPAGENSQPILVGSDLHISCGAAEIDSIYTARDMLTIKLTDAGARNGNLYFFSSKKLHLHSSHGIGNVQIVSLGNNIYKIMLHERKRNVEQGLVISW